MVLKVNIYVLKALVWTFRALLPPPDDNNGGEEEDLYVRLGLSSGGSNVTQEEIRRAYKKKSLQLHPDKVAQFQSRQTNNNLSAEEIAKQFQEVKEAYEILSDPDKRRIYDGFSGTSTSGVAFLNRPEQLMDPMNISRNLKQASLCDKSKLMIIVCLIFGLILCQPILICAKIDQTLSFQQQQQQQQQQHIGTIDSDDTLAQTKWVIIMIPIWFFSTLTILVLSTMNILLASSSSEAWKFWMDWRLGKLISIVTQFVFLALRWDQYTHWSYVLVLIPLFCYQALDLLQAILTIRTVYSDVSKMVTVDYLERTVLNDNNSNQQNNINNNNNNNSSSSSMNDDGGRKYEDLNDEEKDEIGKKYIIVHVPPDAAATAAEQKQQYIEEIRLSSGDNESLDNENAFDEEEMLHTISFSPEYQQRMALLDECYTKLQTIFLFRIAFFVMLLLKLQPPNENGWDWFLVFVPLWLEIGWTMIRSCFVCCCYNNNANIYRNEKDDDDDVVVGIGSYRSSSSSEEEAAVAAMEEQVEVTVVTKSSLQEPLVSTITTNDIHTSQTILPPTTKTIISDTNNITRASGSNYPDMSPLYAKEDMNVPSTATKVTPNFSGKVTSNTNRRKSTTSDNSNEDGANSDDGPKIPMYDTYHFNVDDMNDDGEEDAAMESMLMEQQVKAFSTCCTQIYLSILLTLFLVKLNQADAFVKHLSTDKGYSTFWVLFPPFFICGIIFCCCCLTIYSGVDPDSIANMRNNKDSYDNDDNINENNNNNGSSKEQQQVDPIIVTPPPPTFIPPIPLAETNHNSSYAKEQRRKDHDNPKTAGTDLNHSSYDDELD